MSAYQSVVWWLSSIAGRAPHERQAHLYCVGAPRTGTHSVAALFDRSVRARHEPKLRSAMKRVLAHHRGELSTDALRAFVKARDERMRLDVDSSHVNAFLIEPILAEFAEARFLLTIRDCYSWLDSALNHTVNTRSGRRIDRAYLDFYFDTDHLEYSPHDEFLRQRGLLSVSCYLKAWTRHNQKVLAAVPQDRLMVVKTAEISSHLREIASFAGLAPERLGPKLHAQGQSRSKHGLLERIDQGYLREQVAEHCAVLMGEFFHGSDTMVD